MGPASAPLLHAMYKVVARLGDQGVKAGGEEAIQFLLPACQMLSEWQHGSLFREQGLCE